MTGKGFFRVSRKRHEEQITVGLVQMSAEEDPKANLAKAEGKIRAAAQKGA